MLWLYFVMLCSTELFTANDECSGTCESLANCGVSFCVETTACFNCSCLPSTREVDTYTLKFGNIGKFSGEDVVSADCDNGET